MDIIRDSLMKAKAAKRESIRALKSNGFVAPTPEEPSETSEAGSLNPNRAQPTQRTQTPAFIHAQQRLRDSGVTLPGRGRGQPGVSAPLHPPNYASGRGLRGLESLEATTLGASSMNSELSIGIGRGRSRGRGFGRGAPRIPAVAEVSVPPDYSFDRRIIDVQNLPIMEFNETIINYVRNHPVTLIQGDTGCGKSTQVPQFLLDDAIRRGEKCTIVVTQPRRIAARSLAERICVEREWDLGKRVGYQVGLNRVADVDTNILYVTTGVLVEKLIHGRGLNQWTHIILDEVHERSQDMDLCLLLVRQLMREERSDTRLLLMSASADITRLAEYFSTIDLDHPFGDAMLSEEESEERDGLRLVKPPVVTVAGRLFDVSVFYIEDVHQLFEKERIDCSTQLQLQGREDPFLLEQRNKITKQLILYFDTLDMRKQISGGGDNSYRTRGSVLIFLPGIAEISQLHDYLIGYSQHDTIFHSSSEELRHKWLPLPLHSVISTDKQRKIFDPPPRGYRKIILSTNIAESSITVPDISYVIDFCLTKRLRRDTSRSNFSSLNIEWASKSNCEQRKGRAGRIAEGQCYRLISRQNYANLEQHCPAEIQIAPLEQVILRVKLFDRHPKEMLDQAMDKPSFEDFGHSVLTLKEVGALTVSRRTYHDSSFASGDNAEFQEQMNMKGGCLVFDEDYLDGDLTFVGKLISSLPVDVRVGKMIALGYAFGVLKDAIVVGAGLAGSKSIFKQPFQGDNPQKALDAYERRLYYSAASSSDCFSLRNAYYSWKAFMNSGGDRGRESDLRQWCQQNHLDRRALYDMDALVVEIESRLLRLNIRRPVKDLPNLEKNDDQEVKDFLLQLVIAGAFYPNFFLRTYNQSIETSAERVLDGRNPHFCVELGNLPVERGILYNKQLVTKFKSACMRRAPESCKPKIFFHDSKAVVDFSAYEVMERMKKESTGMNRPLNRAASLPVYLALKMRQIPKLRPFITEVNQTDQLHEALDIYRRQTRMKYEVETDKTECNRLGYDQHIGFPGLHTSRIKMRITHVPECCHFFGVYWENCNLHRDLQKKIAKALADNACPPVPTARVMPGFVCLAPRFKDSSKNEYCRVRLDACDGPSGVSTWLVSSLDFGWTRKLPTSAFLLLPDELSGPHYHYLAVECFVANVGPHSVFRASGDFTEDDRRAFDEILRREERQRGFVGMSIYSLVSTHLRVVLDVSLANLEEHALEYREELMPSRTDHLERLKAQRTYRRTSALEDSEDTPHHREARLRALEQEEEKLMKDLEESVIQSGTIKHQKINLVGPSHPYEMRFCGMTASASPRSVNLVASSINTITLDDQPQCHLDRLLVASLIHSSESHTLNLLESTLMPNLPGLPSLVALIFAPVAELRVNKQRTRYAGALCGLGFDQNGYSLHPNNDMEVTFDIHVDDHLLLNVNKIRLGINLILTDKEWEDAQIGHHEKVVAELQQLIRKDVVDLFLKVRQPRHLVNSWLNEKPFSWRLLPPSAFVNPPEQIRMQLGTKALYQVHHTVTGVDKGGMSDFLRGRNRVLNADPSFDPLQLQEFRPRWENCMRTLLDDLTGQLVRSIEPGAREVASSKVLDQVFVCELCLNRPDEPEAPDRTVAPTYGFVCTTLGTVAEHLRSDEHRRAEMTIRYTRSPQLERVLMLLNR